jgi:hypothetical protein
MTDNAKDNAFEFLECLKPCGPNESHPIVMIRVKGYAACKASPVWEVFFGRN